MIDPSFLKEQAKELAQQTAAAIMSVRLQGERSQTKRDAAASIQDAKLARDAALSTLDSLAEVLLEGAAGKALSQRAATVQAYDYYPSGVDGVQ